MSIVNSEIPEEGVLLEEDYISIPVSLYEDLIRAETERNVLEAAIEGKSSFAVETVLEAIKTARQKNLRGVVRVEIGNCPPAEIHPSQNAATDQVAETEGGNEAEACE